MPVVYSLLKAKAIRLWPEPSHLFKTELLSISVGLWMHAKASSFSLALATLVWDQVFSLLPVSWSFFKKRPKTRQGNCLVFPQASCSPDGLSQDSDHKKALPWLPETGLSSAHSKKISQHTIPSYKTKSIILSLEVHHIHWEYFLISWTRTHLVSMWYNCQRFLTYKHDIFILGVLGFLKTTRSFPKIPEEVRSLPKK